MYTPCDKCGIIVESMDSHECLSNPDIITFETIGCGTARISRDVESATWTPTSDGFADLTLTMKGGSEVIHKVARRTGISVCRRLMGDPR